MKKSKQFINSLAEQVSMPSVFHEISRLLEDEEAITADFVDIIESDSVLALRLMRIASSPYFGFPSRAGSLSQAINQFGLIQLRDLVLSCLALRTFATIPQQVLNLEAFWRYSVQNGIAVRTLAQYGQIMPINPFFTMGLMHEIGHAAIYTKQSELAVQAVEDAKHSERPLVEVERELIGFDYTEVGVELMQLWRMPEVYLQVTAHHLDPDAADERFKQTVAMVHLAHKFCQQPDADDWQQLLDDAVKNDQRLSRLPQNIQHIMESEIASNTDNVLAMLWPNCTSLDLMGEESADG